MSLDGPLVADIEAEQAVLGACMTSPKVVEQVIEIIDGSEDFARPAHQMIWRALVDLALTERPTDPVVLRTLLFDLDAPALPSPWCGASTRTGDPCHLHDRARKDGR